MKKIPLRLGCVFFAGAVVFLLLSQILLWERWAVLDRPIRVVKGFSLSAPFTVDVSTIYEIEVQYAKLYPSQRPDRDTDESREWATAFSASVDQQPLVYSLRCTLNGNVYYSQGKPSCFIGSFRGVRGHTYRLDLLVNRDLPDLAARNPTVRIRVYSAYILDICNASDGASSLGVGLGLLGAICFLAHFLSLRKGRAGKKDLTERVAL